MDVKMYATTGTSSKMLATLNLSFSIISFHRISISTFSSLQLRFHRFAVARSEHLASHFFVRNPSTRALEGKRRGVFDRRLCSIRSMAAAPASAVPATDVVEVLVKSATGDATRRGDCPFSQRVLLTLEEKGIPYDAKVIDLENKPEWFLAANPEGKVPVIKNDGKWVADSDVITALLEEKYPEPPLVTPPEKASIGSKIFPSFVKFLKSKDPADGSEQVLYSELKALDEHLQKNGAYVGGDSVSAVDLSLGPKLYHLEIALRHYKGWTVPSDLTAFQAYTQALFNRETFLKTKPTEDDVIRGWAKHVS